MTVASFTQAAATRGTERVLAWMLLRGRDSAGAVKTYAWSGHVIPDVSTYYGGIKRAKVLSFGHAERELSSWDGELKVSSISASVWDGDGEIRGWLGRPNQDGLINLEVVIHVMPESQWRLSYDPQTVFRGVVDTYDLPDNLVEFVFKEWMAVRQDEDLPLLPLRTNEFASLPAAAQGLYAPVALGTLSGFADRGRIPVIHVGQFLDAFTVQWEGFLVCYGAAKTILTEWQDGTPTDPGQYGVDWAVPGKAGFSTLFGASPYYEVNGYRFTLFYVRGSDAAAHIDGSRPITVDIEGYEDVGDGSGTLIASGYEQLGWLLDNLVLPDTPQTDLGGDWLATPAWSDGTLRRDDATFVATEADAAVEIPSGPDRGFYYADLVPNREVIRDFLVSLDACLGTDRFGRLMLSLLPPSPPTATFPQVVDYVHDILDGRFHQHDDRQQLRNKVPIEFDYDFAAGTFRQTPTPPQDATSKEKYRGWFTAPTRSLIGVANPDTALEIGQRAVLRGRRPPRTIVMGRGTPGYEQELGDRCLITHPFGADVGGFSDRRARVYGLRPVPDADEVEVLAWDEDWIRPAIGVTPTGLTAKEEEIMSVRSLGGSRHATAYTSGGLVYPHDHREVLLDATYIAGLGLTAQARLYLKTGAGSVTPTIRKRDGTLVATGSAVSSASFQEQVIPFSLSGSEYYHVELTLSGGATDAVVTCFGEVELVD